MNRFCCVSVLSLAVAACGSDHLELTEIDGVGDAPDAAPPGSWIGHEDAGREQPADSSQPSPPIVPPDPLAESSLPHCGPPPYQAVTLRARDIQAPAGREQADVSITFKHCPGEKFRTGANGRAVVLVTREAETWICFQSDGYLPWMVGEITIGPALPAAGLVATLVPSSLASTVTPGYQPTSALLFVQVQAGRANATEACRGREGVVLGVKGHPGATVVYRATGSNGSYQKGFGTSAEGVAIVTGLPPGATSVEIVAQKTGCSYTLAYGDASSTTLVPILRTPLAPGVITHQILNPVR
jgi:hypothetical protein